MNDPKCTDDNLMGSDDNRFILELIFLFQLALSLMESGKPSAITFSLSFQCKIDDGKGNQKLVWRLWIGSVSFISIIH
jgi:hypothetical protein